MPRHAERKGADRSFMPAAGHNWSLPLYDPFVRLMGFDRARVDLIAQAAVPAAARVLDVGCGTGTMLTMLARQHPGIEIVGIDPDPNALARAKRKTEGARSRIRLDRGFADALPYTGLSFDRAFSSFVLHHVPADDRSGSLREIRRVLKQEGSLHLLDFVPSRLRPRNRVVRWLHGGDHFKDNDEERVLALLTQAGFSGARVVQRGTVRPPWFRIAYYEARVPSAEA